MTTDSIPQSIKPERKPKPKPKPYAQVAKCPVCDAAGHVGYRRVAVHEVPRIGTKAEIELPVTVDLFERMPLPTNLVNRPRTLSHTFFCDLCEAEFDTVRQYQVFDKARDYVGWMCRDLAADLRTSAEEASKEGEESLFEMYMSDAQDASQLATLIEKAEYVDALAFLRGLDTAARDKFPDGVWAFLELQEAAAR